MYQSKTHSASLADVHLRVQDIGEVKARGLWCNVDPTTVLNLLPTYQSLFAQRVCNREPKGRWSCWWTHTECWRRWRCRERSGLGRSQGVILRHLGCLSQSPSVPVSLFESRFELRRSQELYRTLGGDVEASPPNSGGHWLRQANAMVWQSSPGTILTGTYWN